MHTRWFSWAAQLASVGMAACSANTPPQATGIPHRSSPPATVVSSSAQALPAAPEVPAATFYKPCPTDGDPCLIMPLGDSLTAGTDGQNGYRGELYRLLQATGHPFDFVGQQAGGGAGSGHNGYPGFHIATLLAYVDEWVSLVKPHVILLMMGTNDLDLNYVTHVETYGKVLDRIAVVAPNALVVAAMIPNSQVTIFDTSLYNIALADLIDAKASSGMNVILVDMYSPIRLKDMGPDGVHPLRSGYVKIAQVWYATLGRIMDAH